MPLMHCSRRPTVQTLVFSRSYLHRQVSPPETLVLKGGTTWARNGRWILSENTDFHVTFRDLLHAVNLRHGTNGFTSFPKEGVLRIFSALKNPTASAGFEPANLGTKGQHATSRPPQPPLLVIVKKRPCVTEQCIFFFAARGDPADLQLKGADIVHSWMGLNLAVAWLCVLVVELTVSGL